MTQQHTPDGTETEKGLGLGTLTFGLEPGLEFERHLLELELELETGVGDCVWMWSSCGLRLWRRRCGVFDPPGLGWSWRL